MEVYEDSTIIHLRGRAHVFMYCYYTIFVCSFVIIVITVVSVNESVFFESHLMSIKSKPRISFVTTTATIVIIIINHYYSYHRQHPHSLLY